MRKIALLITLVFLFSLGAGVFAQETELPKAGLTPDSPLYFFEWLSEGIVTFFTFGDLKKAERYATLAAERLSEAQAVVEKGKAKFAEKTLKRYEMQLNKSIARAEKSMKVMTKVGKATSKHLEVLAEVYEKVPEQAKPAIENAIKASAKGHEKAVEILKAKNALGDVPESVSLPENVPKEVRERIQTRVHQELQVEEFLKEPAESFESIRNRCIEQGGPSEKCEKIPLKGFRSFKKLEVFCLEIMGAPSEICTMLESQCREFGVTIANECFRLLSGVATTTYKAAEPTSVTAPSLPEEEAIETPTGGSVECGSKEMIFYYLDACSWCQKIKGEGTIEKLEEFGVNVIQINTQVGPVDYQIQGVPTFVIGGQVYTGYKTFEEIKALLNCQ